ncbi:MAG: acyltransferase [candidate division Zixibacteria bacterium]|nr:acyltransferase [candidate division Zixibacteria bacterium]
MNLIKRLFGNTTPYRVLSWIRNEYLEDEQYRYRPEQFACYGEGVMIERHVRINFPEKVVLKDRVAIYSGTIINSTGGLYIGENTGIGYNCTIFTAQHHYRNAATIPFDNISEMKPVIIREYVWTGAGVMIMPGIEIGEGAIIGMGSVVTKNVPPLAIVMGNPAEVVMYRDKDHYYRCKKEGRYQTISISQYERRLVHMYKVRYQKELKELGML